MAPAIPANIPTDPDRFLTIISLDLALSSLGSLLRLLLGVIAWLAGLIRQFFSENSSEKFCSQSKPERGSPGQAAPRKPPIPATMERILTFFIHSQVGFLVRVLYSALCEVL